MVDVRKRCLHALLFRSLREEDSKKTDQEALKVPQVAIHRIALAKSDQDSDVWLGNAFFLLSAS